MKGFPLQISNFRYGIVILLLCFAVYGNSISNGYSLDDHLVNDNNTLTQKGISGIKEIFTSYSYREKGYNYEYRPVLLLTFAIEYSALGVNPHTSHVISILLFALFSFLLFYFLRIAFPLASQLMIFAGILFFIVHPIHTEVVDNIKSRDDLLCGIFGLSMLIHFQRFLETKKMVKLIFVFLFFLLGFLSKESITVYGAAIPCLYLIRMVEEGRSPFRILIPLCCVIAALALFKFGKSLVLTEDSFSRGRLYYENPLYFAGFGEKIAAGLSLPLFYLQLLFWPSELSYYYGYNQIPMPGWNSALPYLGLLVYAVLIYGVYKSIQKDRLLAFSILILLVNLFATSGILKVMPGIAGERFMFFGSAGFCMAIVMLAWRFFEKMKWIMKSGNYLQMKLPAVLLLCILLIVPAANVFARNKVWKSEYSLIMNDVKHLENSAKANDMAAYQLLAKFRKDQDSPERAQILADAEKHCLRCLEIYPAYIQCLNNLGTIYFIQKRYPESEKYYRKGLEIDSNDANVLFNLATIYVAENQIDNANLFYKKAITANPDVFDLIPVYKQFVIKNHKQADAIVFISNILTNFPQHYNLHLLIIDLYNDQKEYDSALIYLDRAYRIKPSDDLAKVIEQVKQINKK
jgi:tetratricopeptide (TPR) repeat protein